MIFLKLAIIFIIFFAGYGITEIMLPEEIKDKAFWFYPWLGTVLITFLGTALYYGVMSLNPGMYLVIFIAAFLFIYALFSKLRRPVYLKESLLILLMIVISSVIFSPSLNVSTLSSKAEFLKIDSVAGTEGLGRSFYEDSNLLGPASLIAFFSLLLKQKVGIIIDLLSSIYLFLLYPLILDFLKKYSVFSKKPILSMTFSAVILLLVYSIFKLFNFSLFLLIFFGITYIFLILIKDYLTITLKTTKYIINPTLFELLIAVTFSSLAATFLLGFKLVFGLLIFMGILSLFFRKRQKTLFYLSKIIIFTIILNPIIIGVVLWFK
ncbi:MAG: hypothetical protein WCT22_01000 [Patescibacteria group bacterium]